MPQRHPVTIGRQILILLLLLAFGSLPVLADSPLVRTDRDHYRPGEPITVHFSGSPGDDHDWVCIVPAQAPDDEAGDYQYMPRGQAAGTFTFTAPEPGQYEARIYYGYKSKGYVVSGRQRFSVATGAAPPAPAPAPAALPASVAAAPRTEGATSALPTAAAGISLAVFQFTPLNMEASPYGLLAGNTIGNALRREPSFLLTDRKDLEQFLVANDLQQNDRTDNMVLIGSRLGLSVVVAGTVERRGAQIIAQCKTVSVETKKVIHNHRLIASGEAELTRTLQRVADEIREAIRREVP